MRLVIVQEVGERMGDILVLLQTIKKASLLNKPKVSVITHDKYAWELRFTIKPYKLVERPVSYQDFMGMVGTENSGE